MISSRSNRMIKTIRRVRQCKAGDRALLEGPHLVREALRVGLTLDIVLATEDFIQRTASRDLLAVLDRPPLLATAAVFDHLSDADSPRGILAVASLPRLALTDLPIVRDGVFVLAAGIQDPGNIGALARAAEAAGATALALSPGSVHPNHPRSLRASAGSLLRMPTAVEATAEGLLAHLGPAAPRLLALVPRGGLDLYEADLDGCLVLAIGAEGPGLAADLEAGAHGLVTIPLADEVESLNATVAAAVVLFEVARRRGALRSSRPPAR